MNKNLEDKRRTTINALKDADNIIKVLESKGINFEEDNAYKRTVEIRTQLITKLIIIYYPYAIERDYILVVIDGKQYPIPLTEFANQVSKDIYEKVVNFNYHDTSEYVNTSGETIDLVIGPDNIARHIITQEYAFLGLSSGCGTTHTSLMYARALANVGKTAYVELNGSLDISAYSGSPEEEGKITFTDINNLDLYYGYEYDDFVRQFRDMYSYVVMDFGAFDDEEDYTDYVRSTNRFLVSGSARWNVTRVTSFDKEKPINTNSCIYVFPNPNQKNVQILKNILSDARVMEIPFNPEPLEISKEVIKAFKLSKKQPHSKPNITEPFEADEILDATQTVNSRDIVMEYSDGESGPVIYQNMQVKEEEPTEKISKIGIRKIKPEKNKSNTATAKEDGKINSVEPKHKKGAAEILKMIVGID